MTLADAPNGRPRAAGARALSSKAKRAGGGGRLMRALRFGHAWTGFTISLLLAAIALSGTSLIFAQDLARLTTPGASQPPPIRTGAGVARAMAAGQALSPKGFQSVRFADRSFGLDEVMMKDGGAYLDPRTGAVVRAWTGERWNDIVFDFHRHLFLKDLGATIVGWTGFAALLLTFSGLVLWWPVRRSFRGRVVPMARRRGPLVAAHRDLGVMAAPVLIMMLATGSAMALPQLSRPLLHATPSPIPKDPASAKSGAKGVSGEKAGKAAREGKAKGGSGSAGASVKPARFDWSAALALAQARYPDADLRQATPPRRGQPASLRFRQKPEWHPNGRTTLYFAAGGTQLIGVVDALAQVRGVQVFDTFYPLHTAAVGGLVLKVLNVLAGLSLATLALFGAEAYRQKLFPARRPGPR